MHQSSAELAATSKATGAAYIPRGSLDAASSRPSACSPPFAAPAFRCWYCTQEPSRRGHLDALQEIGDMAFPQLGQVTEPVLSALGIP